MRAGTMRDRIELQSPELVTEDEFGPQVLWTPERTVWASVKPIGGTEKLVDQGTQTTVSHEIRIRGGQFVDSKWRAKYRAKYLDFVSVIDVDGLGREWLIEARENTEVAA